MWNGIVARKLAHLQERLAQLRSWELGTLEEFSRNALARNAVERSLQVCAEVVIDVAERILALRDQVPGETSAENLSRLALLGVIRSAAEYQDVVRFRNFIVHRYESVDPAIVYEIVHRKLTVFESFGREVRVYLEAVREPEST